MNKQNIKKLFEYARESINSRFKNSEFKPKKVPEALKQERGVFVTLFINDQLRGCIGFIKPFPLWEGVINTARSSAFSDPRFRPLTKKEFKELTIEISILSQPIKTSYDRIEKGDGAIISKGSHEGLFLPQVWEQLPNKEDFMSQLCMKAGLDPYCYMGNVVIKKFEVKAWKQNPDSEITSI